LDPINSTLQAKKYSDWEFYN